ncbi:MAG TPA: peptide MFS transporter [Bacteroidales bacterium]|nr:peptide MFS transporter [Bacteroidales bacterium]
MYKHPKALVILFFTEMWERFSFYGMRALLTLYLTLQLFKHLQEPEKKATAFGIYAAYGALVYATPFLGGLIADKFLGHKKAVIWGAILMAIGHFAMAIETEFWLYIALSFLILGNGFFKPNISSIVGELYEQNDPRRDGGFTIFYMGVNLGAFLSPLVCGTIGELYGWKYGFGIAGFGMIAGLFIFLQWKHWLNIHDKVIETETSYLVTQEIKPVGEPPSQEKLQKPLFLGISTEYIIYIVSFASVALFALMVKHYELMTYVLTPFSLLVFGIIIVVAMRSPKIERERLFVILILLLFTTLFWAFFEQAGSSLTLFANENVDRNLFSWQIPASLFQSVNPLFIIIFASPFTILWLWLASKKKEPSTPIKFAWGILLLSLGFLVLAIAPLFVAQTSLHIEQGGISWLIQAAAVPMSILIISYFLQTLGELCLSPIGLSMVTKLASPRIVGMVLGAWFLSSAMAHHIAGFIAKATAEQQTSIEVMYNSFVTNIPTNAIDISSEEFYKTYKGALSTGFNRGFDVIQQQGNSLYISATTEDFNTTVIIDSILAVCNTHHMNTHITNDSLFRKSLYIAVIKGIEHMKESGTHAVTYAINKDYINTQTADSYSITTRYSLSNLLQYAKVFLAVGLIALAASALLFALSPIIKRMMHGIG